MNNRYCQSWVSSALALVSAIALGACASNGGGGGGVAATPDTSATAKDGIVVVDTVGGKETTTSNDTAAGTTDGGSGADSATNACCAAKKATCGFVPNCPQSCGGCPVGKQCDTKAGSATQYSCVDKAAGKKLKQNGEACGPNVDCLVPPNGATNAVKQAYYQCLNDQCDKGRCNFGVCTQTCKIALDKKNNASGADAQDGDGIEDADATSECTGFVDGPAGKEFKCVDIFDKANPQQISLCMPGTNFAPCKNNADCKNAEVCSYAEIRGQYPTVCRPAYKEADGKAGATGGNLCNANPKAGPVATCKNQLCYGFGCVDFCKTDSDCVTAAGACAAGKCAGSGAACTNDTDCSAFMCKKDQKIFGKDMPGADVCWPKTCYLDEDCKNSDYYCLSAYNGVDNQDGDPDPKDPTKVKMPGWDESLCVKKAPNTAKKGEPCDDYPNDDDVTLKMCENKYWCVNATCEGHCKADKDCPSNSKCGVTEIPLDTSDPADQKYDVFSALKVCTPMPGATKECFGQGDCKAETKAKYCRPWEYELAQSGTPTDGKFAMGGLCIESEVGFLDPGMQCGQSNGKSCKSGLCFGQQDATGKGAPGWCTDMCSSKADCPASLTFTGYNNQQAKAYCGAINWGNNATPSPLDNVYLTVCLPDVANSSLQDCSSDFKCVASGESCAGIPMALGPDKPATVDFRCRSVKNNPNDAAPTKKVGEVCNPNPAQTDPEECASGLCLPDSTTGKGYCSALCKDNAACGSNDSMFCDLDHQIIARKDAKMAAIAPMCIKKKSCIPCSYDFQCATGNNCTWTDAKAANGHCAPPCSSDADCAKTDGGGKCEAQKDVAGKATDKKVCTPTTCK